MAATAPPSAVGFVRWDLARRTTLLTGCFLALAASVWGQERPGSLARAAARRAAAITLEESIDAAANRQADAAWSAAIGSLTTLAKVRVTRDTGAAIQGAFRMADDDSLTLWIDGADRQFARAEVRRLAVAAGSHERRNTAIGLVISSVVGGLLLRRYCPGLENCDGTIQVSFLASSALGLGVTSILPKAAWRDIYVRA